MRLNSHSRAKASGELVAGVLLQHLINGVIRGGVPRSTGHPWRVVTGHLTLLTFILKLRQYVWRI